MKTYSFKSALVLSVYSMIVVTGIYGVVYLAVQQNYRQNGNDPQIQLAEDGAAQLNQGGVPADLVDRTKAKVELATSLNTWVGVYDQNGVPLESGAVLDGAPPQPPKDLFNPANWTTQKTFTAPAGKETRVTWEPRNGVRQALVLVQAKNGYVVVAGRSMYLLEERVQQLAINLAIGWVITLAILLVVVLLGRWVL